MFAHRRGRLLITIVIYIEGRTESDYGCNLAEMMPKVETEDLIDAQGVARVLGLAHRNTVSVYQRRYREMPRPAVEVGRGRVKLWLRPEIEAWAAKRPVRRSRSTRS